LTRFGVDALAAAIAYDFPAIMATALRILAKEKDSE
jgi:hypothetical protein